MPSLEKQGEGKTYITLQYLSRLALWAYFRNIKIICRAPVPAEGPLLIAANHSNMVLDPIVLIATFPHSRPCHFWALARFFRIPLVGKILKAAGVLPVDTKTHSNAKLFEHTLLTLDRGAVVALFPEGTSYTAPNHLPFKDGISWASFEYLTQLAQREEGPESVSIIPVGITYSTKNRWRSEMVVEYGEPIVQTVEDLAEFHHDPKKSVKNLTDRIAKGVERSTINSPDWDTSHAATEARSILFGDSRGVRLEEYVHVSQSFIGLFHPKNTDDKEALYYKERIELKERLLMFSKQLKSLRLNAGDISMYENQEITMTRATLRLVSTWTGLVVQIPLFLPGIIINSPFYILGRLIDSYEPYTESVSQDKLIFSFFLAMPVYGTLIWLLWKLTGYGLISLLCVLMLLPLFAWYHMALIDKNYDMLKQVIASWRIFIAITTGTTGVDADWTHSREALEDCVRLRRWCRDQTRQLLFNLARHGDPEAQYLVEYGKPLFASLMEENQQQQQQ
ncbi:hypothetical protein FB192DRAFT_1399849 [Mucor lusitanicus]|uniref:Phospholipid/glycerol acyltransferase domain-containing protein n=2 Tax=Mucor circinelloides f. lusitanicus TaxID=29924 RepID=A0A168L0F3_MUCCL|nr:hypothetical protein FB192DRAFT_1399849 [Mucor lusitanicus]OAD02987.1 hypothetical protein MUCCIDRAFT_178425 [Mucor lusitanicus CBS 277.49]